MAVTHGETESRIYTKPLRELTPETSRGFEAITFAETVLLITLFPWEKWLLIHLLELKPDGTLRFRKALVIVARQNGKTLIVAVLAAFFLYCDSVRWPAFVKPQDFVVVGAAQKLDIAMKPWTQVRRWGGPDDLKIGIAHDRVPLLQAVTRMPRTANGETELVTCEGAVYRPRTFDGARGYSSARLILDELRQQYDYEGWSAIEKSATAMYDSMRAPDGELQRHAKEIDAQLSVAGAYFKSPEFQIEREWRLVSNLTDTPPIKALALRPAKSGIREFVRFDIWAGFDEAPWPAQRSSFSSAPIAMPTPPIE